MLDLELLSMINPGQEVILNDGRRMSCCTNYPTAQYAILSDITKIGGGSVVNYREIKEIVPESRVNGRWSDGTPFCR